MILRRFGNKLHSVVPEFDARAMNEIGFRRDNELSLEADELTAGYAHGGEHVLSAEGEGDVKSEVEQKVLDDLRTQIDALTRDAGADALIVIENETGKDYPRTRDKTTNVVVGNENRMHFRYTIDPPLRLSVYRKQ